MIPFEEAVSIGESIFNPQITKNSRMLEIKNTEKLEVISKGIVKVISSLEDRYVIEYDSLSSSTYYFDLFKEFTFNGMLIIKCTNSKYRLRSDIKRSIDKNILHTPTDFIKWLEMFVEDLNNK
jgi:hypothetical protein